VPKGTVLFGTVLKTGPNGTVPFGTVLKAGLEILVGEGFQEGVVGALLEVD